MPGYIHPRLQEKWDRKPGGQSAEMRNEPYIFCLFSFESKVCFYCDDKQRMPIVKSLKY